MLSLSRTTRILRSGSLLAGLLLLSACGGGGGSNPPPAISVTFSTAPPSSLIVDATATVAAAVSNDATNGGVSWSATCAASDCGSFNPTSTASDAPTTYTAPAAVPSPATVTITATSTSDSTQTASATVTISPKSAPPVLADGTYVFHLSGQDVNGPYTVAGAFTVAAGTITGGEQDFTDPNAGYSDTLVAATSSINKAGSNLQIVLDTGNPAIGVSGVETLHGTVVSATRVLLSEFDITAAGTGSLDLQTGAAAPAQGYAFAVSGNDTNGNPLAIGGIMNFAGTALSVPDSVFDVSVFNSNTNTAAVLQKQAFQSGSVTAPDAFGRVTITLTPNVSSGVVAFAFAGYIVGTNRIELVESSEASDVLNANTGGSALGQGANTGAFSATSASVLNQSYAHGSGGVDPNGAATMAGAFALNAAGALGGILAVNDLANIGAWTLGGTYTVDPTGRVTVSVTSLTSQTAAPPANALTFELYLDGSGNAMVMGADGFQTTQGIAYEQGGAFNLAGSYALSGQGALNTTAGLVPWSAVGPVSVSAGAVSGSTDYSVVTLQPTPEVTLTGTQDAANGLLHLTGLNGTDFTLSTGYGYYPLSGNRLWALQVDSQGISLLLLEGVAVTP